MLFSGRLFVSRLHVVFARDVRSPGALVEELRYAAGAHHDFAFWLQHDRRGGVRRVVLFVQVKITNEHEHFRGGTGLVCVAIFS